ncbi:uncharacterized protein LOC106718834 [Papilio machaon]|uniref:uncharacterized protein LOC106718834 n=1 Tax=Papilio machaon TaxID=76193 RepID=UPI001E665C35|nr:uncharacterized protein LOC106718834 [Papilio machaon]
MISKIAILYCLVVSATCMVLHQAPSPLYPLQYQDQVQNNNFDYNANNGQPGNFNGRDNLQETRRGETGLGQYSLRQPDNIPRAGEYRSDDAGYNAYLNNDRRQSNVGSDRYVENINEEARRSSNQVSQINQPWPIPSIQQASPTPVTITQTSVYHQTYSHGHKSWI